MSNEEKKCGCNHEHNNENCNYEHNHENCNHEHNHGENDCCCHHDEELDIVTLVDDQNVEHDFYHLDTIEHKEKYYVVLQPSEKIEGIEEDEVLIYLLNTEGDEDELVPIEDENLLNEVFDEWVKNMEEDK